MGKRVDFSARCVITPDAYFDCNKVGIPYCIAQNLTIPEKVNSRNFHVLEQRVRQGGHSVQGARCVIRSDGRVVDLTACKEKVQLCMGDTVERYIQDGDVVVFNRQPSLHMHGMQTHVVTLMPGHTFRLSLPVAGPYNADFDGDEMNCHLVQVCGNYLA